MGSGESAAADVRMGLFQFKALPVKGANESVEVLQRLPSDSSNKALNLR